MLSSIALFSFLPFLTTAAEGGGVFDLPEIDGEECQERCAHLYFYDKDDNQITALSGTAEHFRESKAFKRGIKNVVKIRQTGYGCHKIYSRKSFKSATFVYDEKKFGANKVTLKEEGFRSSTIGSVRYARNCKFPKKGGFEWWMGVVAVLSSLY